MYNAIHQINHYPVDNIHVVSLSAICVWIAICPVDNEIITFKQMGSYRTNGSENISLNSLYLLILLLVENYIRLCKLKALSTGNNPLSSFFIQEILK